MRDLRFILKEFLSVRKILALLFMAACLCTLQKHASAAAHYVATNGSDSYPGTLTQPWRTINHGVQTMAPGDTLYIRNGTYAERVDVSGKYGSSTAKYVVKNYPGETPIMDTNNDPVRDIAFKFINSSYWHVEGLTIRNYVGAGIWVTEGCSYIEIVRNIMYNFCELQPVTYGVEAIMLDGTTTRNVTIQGNTLSEVGLTFNSASDHGIYMGYGVSGVLIDSNRIYHCSGSGIQLYGDSGASNTVIRNNLIYSNNVWGLVMWNNGSGNFVLNNTFYDNPVDVDVYQASGATFKNNIFGSNIAAPNIWLRDAAAVNNTFDYNCYWSDNGYPMYIQDVWKTYTEWQGYGQEVHGRYGNPSFVDALNGNFRLANGSNCIGTGIDAGVQYDFAGTLRDTSSPDIGAYDYSYPTVTPSAGANGTISPSTAQTVTPGSSLTFTATPNTGYTVNQWLVDGSVVQTGGTTYTLNNVTANHAVQVTFKQLTYTVTPSAGSNGSISPNTAQTVNYAGSVAFIATPNAGRAVNQWSVDGSIVQTGGTSYTISNVTANHAVSVTFKQLTYAVTPSAGSNGSISPNTAQTVNSGGNLTLTATPNTGYSVNQWSVDGSVVQTGGTSYTISNVTANHAVSVTFKQSTYTVTPSAGTNGSISPNTAQTVNYGGNATFTATPNTGYTVNQWSVDGSVVQTGGTSYAISNVTANHAVSVTFKQSTYTVTPSAGANGTISPSTAQTVTPGSSLTFTATPNTGYTVNQWSVDGSVVQTGGATYILNNVTANHAVSVTFKQLTYTVTPSAGTNGSISPNTAQTVNYGGSATFTATPNANCTVNQWSVNGSVVQTGGATYTLQNVTANHTVSVTFKSTVTYTLTPSAGTNGSITPNTPQTVNSGGNLTFTATPNSGYTVNQWSVDGSVVQAGGTSFTISNVTANHSVSVTFKTAAFTLTPYAGANGTISPNTAQIVNYGGSKAFTATPGTGYVVGVWSVDGIPVRTGGVSYTLSNVTANHTVSVTFNIKTFAVTPSAGVNGNISPNTVQSVNYGGSVTFTAIPNPGYTVNQWLVNGIVVQTGGTTRTLSNVTANRTVSVTFKAQTFKVTPSAGAHGTISPNLVQTVNYGGSKAFTATPVTGYTVDIWSVDGSPVQLGGTTYTVSNVTGDHTVSVTFIAKTLTVTPSAGANGTISPDTAQTVNYGGSVTFTALPNTGYTVNQWLVNGSVVQTGSLTRTLSSVTANRTVSVTFKAATFKLTPSAGANGTISPSTAQMVSYGGSKVFTAKPNTGYTVGTWSVDGVSVQTGGTTYTLSDVTANHTISVTFIRRTFTLSPSAGDNGSISPSTEQTVSYGGSKTFTATPGSGYTVNQWMVDGNLVKTGGNTYTLYYVIANHTVLVTFK